MKASTNYGIPFAIALAVASSSSVALAGPPSPQPGAAPSAEAVAEAKTRYARGQEFLKEGSYELASVELQRAYALAPNYRILYNLGLVQLQLTDYAAALRSFEGYLSEGGGDVPADRRAEVKKHLDFLAARIGRIDVSVSTKEADISIDDVPVGAAPLPAPVVVNAGRRKITASREGFEPAVQVITVGAGETVRLTLTLAEPRKAVATTAMPVSVTTEAPAPKHTVPWVPWAITGALGAGAIGTGIAAVVASSNLKDAKAAPNPDPVKLQDLEGQAKVTSLVADVLIASTIVAGGVALYFTFKRSDAEKPPVQVGFTGTGLVAAGRF